MKSNIESASKEKRQNGTPLLLSLLRSTEFWQSKLGLFHVPILFSSWFFPIRLISTRTRFVPQVPFPATQLRPQNNRFLISIQHSHSQNHSKDFFPCRATKLFHVYTNKLYFPHLLPRQIRITPQTECAPSLSLWIDVLKLEFGAKN